MTAKNFLFLLSASAADRAALQQIHGNVTTLIDANAKPLWFDPTHVGYFISSALSAQQIWLKAFHELGQKYTQNLRDAMILEIGGDYAAGPDSKAAAWLNSHSVIRKLGPT